MLFVFLFVIIIQLAFIYKALRVMVTGIRAIRSDLAQLIKAQRSASN